MQGDAGGVDHRTQRGFGGSLCLAADGRTQIIGRGQLLQRAGQYLPAQVIDALPHQIGEDALGQLQRGNGRLAQYLIHFWQTSQKLILFHLAHSIYIIFI